MELKFVPNLFLEVTELNRFKDSLDSEGFRKQLLEQTESYGLVKNQKTDATFLNGKVEQDVDNIDGDKTIKIRELFGVNQLGLFIYQPEVTQIVVPSDENWYWVRVSHQYTTKEKGTFSIDVDGNLVGSVDAELLTIFRGMPNFPTRITFLNSAENTLEYDVLEVTDNQNAVLQHPSLTIGGDSDFVAETDLEIAIVGTFTPGVVIPSPDKYPFQYDSCYLQLVEETSYNQRPAYTSGTHFDLARIRLSGAGLIIQDKRTEIWESKGAQKILDIERVSNPLIGVENVKWDHELASADTNIVEIAWGMRSQNWSVDTNLRQLTLFGSATGGKFKTVADFTDNDFNGWRVYTQNGKYSKVLSSTKTGSAINLVLDVLDIDNYSDDGGVTINASNGEWVLVVPDADSIDIKCSPSESELQEFMTKTFNFPINTLLGKLQLVVYKTTSCLYNIQYRYKSYKEFTEFVPIDTDTGSGYYDESSFNVEGGNLKSNPADRTKKTYTTNAVEGFIELVMAPHSNSNFRAKVDKGDIIGVNSFSSLASTLYELEVGVSDWYQYLTGSPSLPGDDVYFSLLTEGAVEGNEFTLHLNCDDITLGGFNIIIAYPGPGMTTVVLKTITEGDVYQMKNKKGGIVFKCVYSGSQWILSQNYELGRPGEIITLDGVINDLFDGSSLGKVVGLYGYALCNGSNGTPNLTDKFIIGAGNSLAVGATGGESTHTLTEAEMPAHTHPFYEDGNAASGGQGNHVRTTTVGTYPLTTGSTGGGDPHNNMPPYHALIYAKKLF